MDIKIDLNGVQEGRKYVLEFCIREGVADNILPHSPTNSLPVANDNTSNDNDMPSLDDIENINNAEFKMPDIDTPLPKRKIKVERSWEGELD